MSDFAKVTGPGYEETNAAYPRHELTVAQQRLQAQQQETITRSMVTLAALLDAMEFLISSAPKAPQNQKALANLVDTFDRARAAVEKVNAAQDPLLEVPS